MQRKLTDTEFIKYVIDQLTTKIPDFVVSEYGDNDWHFTGYFSAIKAEDGYRPSAGFDLRDLWESYSRGDYPVSDIIDPFINYISSTRGKIQSMLSGGLGFDKSEVIPIVQSAYFFKGNPEPEDELLELSEGAEIEVVFTHNEDIDTEEEYGDEGSDDFPPSTLWADEDGPIPPIYTAISQEIAIGYGELIGGFVSFISEHHTNDLMTPEEVAELATQNMINRGWTEHSDITEMPSGAKAYIYSEKNSYQSQFFIPEMVFSKFPDGVYLVIVNPELALAFCTPSGKPISSNQELADFLSFRDIMMNWYNQSLNPISPVVHYIDKDGISTVG